MRKGSSIMLLVTQVTHLLLSVLLVAQVSHNVIAIAAAAAVIDGDGDGDLDLDPVLKDISDEKKNRKVIIDSVPKVGKDEDGEDKVEDEDVEVGGEEESQTQPVEESSDFETLLMEEPPLIENGLLVLDHENLLETMTGRTSSSIHEQHQSSSSSPSSSSKNGSTLLLLAFHEPWCQKSIDMIHKLEQAAQNIQVKFADGASDFYFDLNFATTTTKSTVDPQFVPNILPTPPIFGKMDTSVFENEDLIEFFGLFDSTDHGLPALKFIFIEQNGDGFIDDSSSGDDDDDGEGDGIDNDISGDDDDDEDDDDEGSSGDVDHNHNIENDGRIIDFDLEQNQEHKQEHKIEERGERGREQGIDNHTERTIIDFLGDSKTTEGIVDTVMHYWYRFAVSRHISHGTIRKQDEAANTVHNTTHNNASTARRERIPTRPIFAFPDTKSIFSFIRSHEALYHPVKQDLTSVSEQQEVYIRDLLETEGDPDPFLAFVQCRNQDKKKSSSQDTDVDDDSVSNLFQQFDDLAQTFIYRRDVAFFVVISDDCSWMKTFGGDEVDQVNALNGSVTVWRINSSSSSNRDKLLNQGGIIFPRGKDGDVHSSVSMAQFGIIQSTPPIMWFDQASSSSIAFPIYRKSHFVLFVDMHTSRLKNGSFNLTSTAYEQSKYAISQFHKAALHHRQSRPLDDVVFLIVPSTETQVLTTFGIDIWSSMDEACTSHGLKYCYPDNIPELPMAMITSRRESDSTMLRFYLSSDELLNRNEENTLANFLLDYLHGRLISQIKSEETPATQVLSSGVHVLTGDTFEELVMLKTNKHTLVQFYAPHCGHCKRFNVIWKELAELVKDFHWDSVVDVMMMDVTKNEVFHQMIDVRYIPSVYLFPKNQKELPIEMKIQGDDEGNTSNVGGISDVNAILDWMIESNIFDDKELLSLIEKEQSPQ